MNKPSQPDTRKGKYDRDGDRLRGAVDSAADLVSGAETTMTESRGAMTAQQFWPEYWTGERLAEWLNLREPERTKALQWEFADALSAHNAAQLQKEVERTKGYDAVLAEVGKLQGIVEAGDAENVELRAALEVKEKERESALSKRKHTQDWYAAHYGKLEDWARKRLPDPWRNEFFHCVANGTWGHDDLGEPYMSQVGRIVPSGYFKMDSAAEQLLRDQTIRAETAEAELSRLRSQGAGQWEAALRRYGHHDFSCTMRSSKKLCDCGLDTALAGLASPPESKP